MAHARSGIRLSTIRLTRLPERSFVMGNRSIEECDGCPGLCCKGLEENIIRPRTKQEVADILWQLHFENINFFIRNKRWYQLILGRCIYLDENDMCSKYDKRPEVCRDHNPPACEHHGSIYDTLFETPEDLEKWIAREEKRKKRKRSARN